MCASLSSIHATVSRATEQRLAPPIVRGSVLRRRVSSDPELTYRLFVSNAWKPGVPLFVAVHGIRRGDKNQASQFAPYIDSIGGVLVAPLFPKKRFPDYQRLGRLGRGLRADLAFKRILADVGDLLGTAFPELVMFGYSGGGQFVHRYAMANPRQVKRVAIAAPGWFTFPDMSQPYPRGIGRTSTITDLFFDPARFLNVPALVLVGEKDVLQDANLNTNRKIDSQQGGNRLDRARRWIAAMTAAAQRFQLPTPYRLEVLNGCGHSFNECMQIGNMGHNVINFLFPDGRPRPVAPGGLVHDRSSRNRTRKET